jgi:hypothetical protein
MKAMATRFREGAAMDEAQSIQNRVRESIEPAQREQNKVLDLQKYGLSGQLGAIPDEVFDLPQLETLELFGNNIREVPERIGDLVHLKRLSVMRNPIERVHEIPGLALDWASYLRCRKPLSRENVADVCLPSGKGPAG